MARTSTQLAIDEELLTALRALAARTGRAEDDVVEEALRRYMGLDSLLEQIWAANPDAPNEQQALDLAYAELRAARAERE